MKTKAKKIFIGGSDTDVGKTYFGSNLAEYIQRKGHEVVVFKPIETGCNKKDNILIPNDSTIYKKILKKVSIDLINPFRFEKAISPARAIALSKKKITIDDYVNKSKLLPKHELIIVEGAGGICSPIATDGLNIDLLKKMKLPVILVVKDQIGSINQVLLNLSILEKYKIRVFAIILNKLKKTNPKGMNNLREIKSFTKIPIVQLQKNNSLFNAKSYRKIYNLIYKT